MCMVRMFHLEADDDVRSPLLALGHDVVHVELVRHLLGDVVHNSLHLDDNVHEDEDEYEVDVHDGVHLLLPSRGCPSPAARLPGLQLEDSLEELLGSGR